MRRWSPRPRHARERPQVLVDVLQSENQAAAAQAAGALWSLCVDNDANKQVPITHALPLVSAPCLPSPHFLTPAV